MFDHTHLETILAVERAGSYEAAAKKLNMTSAAVSRRMRTLEERVGVVLLNRDGKATPTEMGLRFCRYAETIENMERDLLRSFSVELAEGCASAPKLRVILDHDSMSTWFLDVIEADARSDDPRLFDLTISSQDSSLDAMQDGHALTAVSGVADAMHGYRARFLGTHTFRAVATHAFVRRWFPGGATTEALLAAPSLSYGARDTLPERWLRTAFGEAPNVPTHFMPCSQSSTFACRRSVGWAVVPSQIADPLLRSNDLTEILPDANLDCPLYWHFSIMAEKALQPVTRMVMEAATKHLGQASRNGGAAYRADGT